MNVKQIIAKGLRKATVKMSLVGCNAVSLVGLYQPQEPKDLAKTLKSIKINKS